ncbi:MAG TPA: ribosomal protein S18-alanine N-acetyltransferase [Solirubrobacteraceae bacterium]|jgi:ribosomal-protein-alanine N-acetyltransferase
MPSPDPPPPPPRTDAEGAEQITIRRLGLADLPQVIAIERRAFVTPWSSAMFVLELSKASSISVGAFLPGRRRAGSLTAYLIASRYADVWHLMNVAVDPPVRRRGLAGLLLEELIARVSPAEPITLEVRPSNGAAIALYKRFGFQAAGLRPGYYRDTGEDALIMWRAVEDGLGSEGRR